MREAKSRSARKHESQVGERNLYTGKWVVVILSLHLLLGCFYWVYTPFGVSPDEGVHAAYVRELAAAHRLPVFSASDPSRYETHQPPLYYLLGVPFYWVAKAFGVDEPGAAVRLLSLVLGGLSVLITYWAVSLLLQGRQGTVLACAGFVAFLPMHLALSVSVSNDVLTELVFGVTLFLIGRTLVQGPSRRSTVWLGLVLGAGLLTKTTCLVLFPIVCLAYVLLWQQGALSRKQMGSHVLAVFGISLVVGGWWLVRNSLLYGDPLGLTKFKEAFAHTAKPDYWLGEGWSWGQYFLLVAGWTFASFWGVFGHMKIFMPSVIYYTLAGVTLAALGRCVRPIAEIRASSPGKRDVVLVYLATTALVVLVFIRFNVSFFQAQGRYLYPALVPIALFWVLGFERLLPSRNRVLSGAVVNAGMFLLALLALFVSIIPEAPYHW